ncbi:MAG: hypothetical protein Q7S11_01765 [bacterium]|nr:hypothetical protein [bacterium]
MEISGRNLKEWAKVRKRVCVASARAEHDSASRGRVNFQPACRAHLSAARAGRKLCVTDVFCRTSGMERDVRLGD